MATIQRPGTPFPLHHGLVSRLEPCSRPPFLHTAALCRAVSARADSALAAQALLVFGLGLVEPTGLHPHARPSSLQRLDRLYRLERPVSGHAVHPAPREPDGTALDTLLAQLQILLLTHDQGLLRARRLRRRERHSFARRLHSRSTTVKATRHATTDDHRAPLLRFRRRGPTALHLACRWRVLDSPGLGEGSAGDILGDDVTTLYNT